MTGPETMTVAEAARSLRVSPSSVQRWARTGFLPTVQLPGIGGGCRRKGSATVRKLLRSDVAAFAAGHGLGDPDRPRVQVVPRPKGPRKSCSIGARFPGLATKSEAARACGVAPMTVCRWIAAGDLASVAVPPSGPPTLREARRVEPAAVLDCLRRKGYPAELVARAETRLGRPAPG
jgi:hypothetical protein